jgi:hypothetical protein
LDSTEAFKIALRQYGQPLTTEHVHPDTAPGFEEFLQFFRDFMVRNTKLLAENVHCDWVANVTFNALATYHMDYELIGIFAGVPLMIYNHFYCFLSDPSVLPLIGNPSGETPDELAVNRLRLGHTSPPPRGPRDPLRCDAAMHLAWNAVMFVFFHELSQIVGCHLRLLSESVGSLEYLEVPVVPISSKEAHLRLLLEIEADQGPSSFLFSVWRSMWDRGALKAIEPLGPELSLAISLAMLFLIMDGLQPANRRPRYSTHPPPIVRLIHLVTLAVNQRFPNYVFDEETALRGLQEVIRWAEKARLRISSEDHGITMHVHEELNALRMELADNYSDRLTQYRDERRRARSHQVVGR